MTKKLQINNQRNSSIEMLRLVAMFFVVMSHSAVHSAFPSAVSTFSLNSCLLDWMTLGNLGTDIFVVLSGWNLFGKQFRIKSVLSYIVQIWTISVLGLIVYALSGGDEVSVSMIAKSVFPIMSGSWWFATAYFVLFLLTPYMNIFVENISRRQLQCCLWIMITLWCIIPTFSSQDMYGNQLLLMIMFYLTGAYLRKYPDNFWNHKKRTKYILLLSGILLLLSSTIIRWLSANVAALPFKPTMLYGRSSVLVICCAVSMTALSVYAIPWKNSIINTMGACTFGIYLLSEHPLIKDRIWTEWIDNSQYFPSNSLAIRLAASVIVVYFVCGVIECCRITFFSRPLMRFAEKVYAVISNWVCMLAKRAGKILERVDRTS